MSPTPSDATASSTSADSSSADRPSTSVGHKVDFTPALGLSSLLPAFRHQVRMTRLVGVVAAMVILAAFGHLVGHQESQSHSQGVYLFGGLFFLWLMLVLKSAQRAREIQATTVLLSMGRLDEAEMWIRRALTTFSLSVRTKLVACQQLGLLAFQRGAHPDVVAICRELLRYRLRGGLRKVWFNTRLMLADSLLVLDRVGEAYEAIRPLYDSQWSLVDRVKLLPVELRYELAAGHVDVAVANLAEKIRLAELLDSPRAALVHLLLAEACRRRNLPQQYDFLMARARLYHDLDEIVQRYPVVRDTVGKLPTQPPPA